MCQFQCLKVDSMCVALSKGRQYVRLQCLKVDSMCVALSKLGRQYVCCIV